MAGDDARIGAETIRLKRFKKPLWMSPPFREVTIWAI
jgi:hypothetical protein